MHNQINYKFDTNKVISLAKKKLKTTKVFDEELDLIFKGFANDNITQGKQLFNDNLNRFNESFLKYLIQPTKTRFKYKITDFYLIYYFEGHSNLQNWYEGNLMQKNAAELSRFISLINIDDQVNFNLPVFYNFNADFLKHLDLKRIKDAPEKNNLGLVRLYCKERNQINHVLNEIPKEKYKSYNFNYDIVSDYEADIFEFSSRSKKSDYVTSIRDFLYDFFVENGDLHNKAILENQNKDVLLKRDFNNDDKLIHVSFDLILKHSFSSEEAINTLDKALNN